MTKLKNKLLSTLFGLTLAIFGASSFAYASTETIDNFHADIFIQKNAVVTVEETITYNFGSNEKHGIFRDIPLTSPDGPDLAINIVVVENEFGSDYGFTTSQNGNFIDLKIGNPDILVSGIKTYRIKYQIYNAIRADQIHDELYWNITGDQWPPSIEKASATVYLPASNIPNINTACFTGPAGSTEKNCTSNKNPADTSAINFAITKPLNPYEGLTAVIGLPLGYIDHTSAVQIPINSYAAKSSNNPSENPYSMIVFVVLFFTVWISLFLKGIINIFRKNKPKPVIPSELKDQPIVVEYNPPDKLPPIEIGTILDRRVDVTDISSVIMDLAVRGYIKICYTVKEIPFWPDKKDFELVKLRSGADLTHPADKLLFNFLFDARDKVKLSSLENDKLLFQGTIKKIQDETEQNILDKGYFDQAAKDKSKKLSVYIIVLVVIIFVSHFITIFFSTFQINTGGIIFLLGIVGILIVSAIVKSLSNKLTTKGVSTMAKILGFREFLQLTESDKLAMLNAPDLKPTTFEKFLPYAMVLGVEDQWAKKFEGIYNTTPKWYMDPTNHTFNSLILIQSLNNFSGSFNQVFNITSPRSSGFSGGSSGGGSGGGGGGSW